MSSRVKAVIPAAGYGTRLQPVTYAVAKELLPVARKPMIHLAVEEAVQAGVEHISVIIRKGKECIRDYIDSLSGEQLKRSGARITFIYQNEPLGLGNAVYQARRFIADSPFMVIIPDQFVFSDNPPARRILNASGYDPGAVWCGFTLIPAEQENYFPNCRPYALDPHGDKFWRVRGFAPRPEKIGEKISIGFGRTYYPPGTLTYFSEKYMNPDTGEVDMLRTFQALLEDCPCYAIHLEGTAADFGTWPGYEYFTGKTMVSLGSNINFQVR